jgi:hypothetical protein
MHSWEDEVSSLGALDRLIGFKLVLKVGKDEAREYSHFLGVVMWTF